MSLIKNLIKEPDDQSKIKQDSKSTSDEEKNVKPIIKSALDLQRLKLEKLMKNPDKPVIIPEHRKEKDYMQSVPTFVRNVMGSSAGAGSGEFHVYRHLRRKEYARQKMIQSKSHQEILDDEYKQKLEENRKKSEEKTAKKRARRLKKKIRSKKPKLKSNIEHNAANSEDEDTADSNAESEDKEKVNEAINTETSQQLESNEIIDDEETGNNIN